MKLKYAAILIFLIVFADQVLKIWVKTNMYLGEYFSVSGNWFYIHFTENNGMAFGMEFAGDYGKLILSVLRLISIVVLGYVLYRTCSKPHPVGLVVSIAMIFAGALGNIIDSVFYGKLFGYNELLYGKVVDMFYFPIIESTYPDWFPFWAGEEFIFFRPVFNIADSSITVGVFMILIFQKGFFKPAPKESPVEAANLQQ